MTQDELKQAVANAARDYVAEHLPAGAILGVGTGSTANFFIDAVTTGLMSSTSAAATRSAILPPSVALRCARATQPLPATGPAAIPRRPSTPPRSSPTPR